MCKCLKEIEEKVKNELSINNSEYKGIEIKRSYFTGKYLDCETSKNGLGIPLQIEWNLTYKSGKEVCKKKELDMIAKYCPFCGVKYE